MITYPIYNISTSVYTEGALSTSGGTMTPSGTFTVNYGATPAFTFSKNIGYLLSGFKVNGTSRANKTLDPVTSNLTVCGYYEKEYVTGYVLDQNGKGVEGAKLTFYHMGADHQEVSNGTATTGANGYYSKWKLTDRAYINIVPEKERWTFVENGNLYNYKGTYHPPLLVVSQSQIQLDYEPNEIPINVSSDVSWTVSDDMGWITTSPAGGTNNGTFFIKTSRDCGPDRTGTVKVSGGGTIRAITVVQSRHSCAVDEVWDPNTCLCKPEK